MSEDNFFSKENSLLIKCKNECSSNDFNYIINYLQKNEKNETEKMSTKEKIKFYDTYLKIIEAGFTSKYYNTSNLDNGIDEAIKTEKMTVTFSTLENQKNNINKKQHQ